MNILVNYAIKNNKVFIKKYHEDDELIVLFNDKVAITSSELDTTQELTLLQSDKLPFPLLLTKAEADVILNAKKDGDVVIENGELFEEEEGGNN